MKSLSFRFITSIFAGILWIIVLVNFLGWTGIDFGGALGFNTDWLLWDNHYFGFSSILDSLQMLDGYNGISIAGYEIASPTAIFETIRKIGSALLLNIPEIINRFGIFVNSTRDGSDVFRVLYNLYMLIYNGVYATFPIVLVIGYSIVLAIQVVTYVAGFIGYFGACLSGMFNKSMPNLSDLYEQWSSYIIS